MIALVALLMAPSVIDVDLRQPSADLPFVSYSTAQPGALREDALVITVERDGSVYLLRDRIMPEDLPGKIRNGVIHGSEAKAYLQFDARASYRDIKRVLDGIHKAGIEKIVFIVNQPKPESK
jgi:biopolymer transport protein ExbD